MQLGCCKRLHNRLTKRINFFLFFLFCLTKRLNNRLFKRFLKRICKRLHKRLSKPVYLRIVIVLQRSKVRFSGRPCTGSGEMDASIDFAEAVLTEIVAEFAHDVPRSNRKQASLL